MSIESKAGIKIIKATGEYPQESTFCIAYERGNDLIRKTYRDYPYYAINSEIIDRLFQGNEAERIKNEKKKYTKSGQILFTIGYEGKSIEGFINTLIENDVRLLCDVRKNPVSRKFGFSKRKLKHITETVGIDTFTYLTSVLNPASADRLNRWMTTSAYLEDTLKHF